MKILYFHQHFSTPRGSGGSRSYEMARALIQSGHDVTMVCGSYDVGDSGLSGSFERGRRRGEVDGIHVLELELPYGNDQGLLKRSQVFLAFAFRSLKVALTEKTDLVFATSTPLTAGIPGIAAKLFRRKPFVFEVRDLWPELPKAMGVVTNPVLLWMMAILEKTSYRCADGCIGLAPGMVEGIKRVSPGTEHVTMISNGCDVELFEDAVASRKDTIGLPDDALVAIFAGAHGMANGLDAALDAASVLKSRGRSDVHMVFMGSGRLKAGLIERAAAEGLDNCHFLDGVPKTRLGSYIKSADVGLMLLANVPEFRYGTSPNKFFDYLSLGMPVLTNYPGWVASIIEEESLGVVVPPEQPEAFADALEAMADERSALAAMGDRSARIARTRFNRQALGQQFVAFLEACYQRASQRD